MSATLTAQNAHQETWRSNVIGNDVLGIVNAPRMELLTLLPESAWPVQFQHASAFLPFYLHSAHVTFVYS